MIEANIQREQLEDLEIDRALVHIVDDDALFCEAVKCIVETEAYEARVYRSAEDFLSNYCPVLFQCAIVDLRLPGINGLELQEVLLKHRQHLPLIVISAFGKTPEVVQAMRRGAANYLEKPVNDFELIAAVQEAIASDCESKQRFHARNRALWRLSERERQVAELFIEAKATIEIAHILGISPKTVEKHRINIFQKTDVDSIPALIRLLVC